MLEWKTPRGEAEVEFEFVCFQLLVLFFDSLLK